MTLPLIRGSSLGPGDREHEGPYASFATADKQDLGAGKGTAEAAIGKSWRTADTR